MEKYLLKLHKLNQKIRDKSEFSAFLSSADQFLKGDESHSRYIRSIKKGLKKIRSKPVLAVIFEIASFINTERSFINKKILIKYLKDSITRDSVLKYLNTFKIQDLDAVILKLINKNSYPVTDSICRYIANNEDLLKDFLYNEDSENICRQLEFISKCNVFYNIRHYIQYMGHNSKLIALKAFEAFSMFFKLIRYHLRENSLSSFMTKFEIIDSVCVFPDDVFYLNIPAKSLQISNLCNFIQFGWKFISEKDLIVGCFEDDDTTYRTKVFTDIFLKYSANEYSSEKYETDFNELNERGLYDQMPCKLQKEEFNPKNMVFDHLFGNSYRKDCCGCYEG